MSFDDLTYDRIEAYLNGEMSSSERAAFEKELSLNQKLSKEVDKHKLANDLVLENRLLSVKDIFQQEHFKATQQSSYSKYIYSALALAVAVGTAIALFVYTNDQAESKEEVKVVETSTRTSSLNSIEINKEKDSRSSQSQLEQTPEPTYLRKQDVQLIEEQHKLNVIPVETNVEKNPTDIIIPIQKVETNQDEKTSNKTEVAKNVCADVVIKADIKTSATCLHESTGNVLVYNIQGGTKPYAVAIHNSHKESVVNGTLTAGIYQIHITDSKSCEKIYSNIQIVEKDCPIDYSFNPFIGEKWSIESYKSEGQLEIYNKGGVLHYKMNVDANSANEWTGVGFNNQIMLGYYIFVIKYADGTVKKGSVTIVQ